MRRSTMARLGGWRLGGKRPAPPSAPALQEVERRVGDLELAARPSSFGHDWCELWVDECLEDEIGEEAFTELPERLAAALGLARSDVVWEDREVVHVRAGGRSADVVLDGIVTAAGLA